MLWICIELLNSFPLGMNLYSNGMISTLYLYTTMLGLHFSLLEQLLWIEIYDVYDISDVHCAASVQRQNKTVKFEVCKCAAIAAEPGV